MKIIFDVRQCGLGNNGGSLTIVKSANALVDLKHEVYIVDSMKNKHTWNTLYAEHIIAKNDFAIPSADIIVATGYKTVGPTLRAPERCGLKAHYIRAWELWQGPESWIVNNILNASTIKVVNSLCLQKKLKSYNFESTIIRPGNDFEDYYPLNLRKKGKVVLGGLYHTKHKTKRSDWVILVAQALKRNYKHVQLHMFGTNKKVNHPVIDKYICQPTVEQKNKFFNEIDIFLSPTNLEGLHIVPQEAMLTECAIITTDAEMSGTQDYINHMKTGFVSNNTLKDFFQLTDTVYNNRNTRMKIASHGREKILKMGDRKQNMQKFADFFMEKIK